jgi:hypothetical protein
MLRCPTCRGFLATADSDINALTIKICECDRVDIRRAPSEMEAALRRLVAAVQAASERPDLLAVRSDLLNAMSMARSALKEPSH